MTRSGASAEVYKVPVAGGDLEVELRGLASRSSSAPLILLHGWTLDRRMWEPQLQALSRERPVIAIDRRGFGRSTASAAIHQEADDVIAVQDFFGLRNSVIVGMSQAGQIALEFAARHPDRLVSLILQGSGLAQFQPPPKSDESIPIDQYRTLVENGDIDEMRARWRRHPLMTSPNREALKQMDAMLRSYDGRDLLASTPSFGVSAGSLDIIEAPTLAVTGDQETPWRRLAADAIAYGVQNGRRAFVERAGHVCNLCNPERFNEVITTFLNA